MAEIPRKTLGLPARKEGEERPLNPKRKPVRGTGAGLRRPTPVAEEPNAAEPARKVDWRNKSKKKRDERPTGRVAVQARKTADPGEAPRPPRPVPAKPVPASSVSTALAGVRVSKLMAERGMCSRREADSFIERGWVYVDGERVSELGTRVDPGARISLDKEARAAQQRQMTVLLHKPVGYVSGQPEPGCEPAVVLIRPENQQRSPDTALFHASHLKGLAPAGRLDIDSTGLLVLTQDGRVARQLIGENSKVEKEYLVRVEGQLVDNGLALLNHGLALDGKSLKPARVEWLNDDQLRFILNEGRKRQIRRMCELVGLRVVGLKRVRIGRVRLSDLPLGKWRYLRDDEAF